MECEVQKYCVSFVSCAVAGYGINVVAQSWNNHSIPGQYPTNEILDTR